MVSKGDKEKLMKYYFDMETTGLNPYDPNAKILTAQVRDDEGTTCIFTEWGFGEKVLIDRLTLLFKDINFDENGKRTYNPVFTYNGAYDFNYLMGRITQIFDNEKVRMLHDIFIRGTKHCDLLQFDNGYFVSLSRLCREYDIKMECKYLGKDVYNLYQKGEYEHICDHAKDDIDALWKLVTFHGFDERFLRKPTLIKTRWEK